MKLEQFKDSYRKASAKVSDITRTCNFSIIAVCWILAKEDVKQMSSFKWILFLVILSLICDFLQYAHKAFIGYLLFLNKYKDNKAKSEEDILQFEVGEYPPWFHITTWIWMIAKIIICIIALCMLAGVLLKY